MLSDSDFEELCVYCGLDSASMTLPATEAVGRSGGSLSVLSEAQLSGLMKQRAGRDSSALNFIAAGHYQSFIPALVKAETLKVAATGLHKSLEADHKQQTIEHMLVTLTTMSHCTLVQDDISALLASLLMACCTQEPRRDDSNRCRVLIPATVSPLMRNTLRTLLKYQAIDLIVVDYNKNTGALSRQQLGPYEHEDIAAIILAWPNFFGILEDIESLSKWAADKGCRVIGLTDPLTLCYLDAPFKITAGRFDYLLGSLQSVGLSASQCGNSPAFIASAAPMSGELGPYLETNQRINYTAVIHDFLATRGLSGLHRSVQQANQNLRSLVQELEQITNVSVRFSNPFVNECCIHITGIDLPKALKILSGHNMILGVPLLDYYPELTDCLLIYCSDQHSAADREKLVNKVTTVVRNLSTAGCPVKPKF